MRSLRTVHLRVQRQSDTATRLAEWLRSATTEPRFEKDQMGWLGWSES